ncbi:MAG: potassium transporter [Tateyamaria sp.]|jgi:CPA2 family monovalent cation:H+ antiporter-2|nr:potassium transporter [Tateyamaria sp.]MBT6342931.1 potassium transporter [Tateyamaria sp.]MBT7447929.1 potassium transporter [Tateyamaria sp.]
MESFLYQASIYLAAAVIAVPIAARLGLGSVLGYLAAGILIGPVFDLVGSETADLQHFAEFGVVMMLFLIGLELEPKALWDMRHKLFGLGGLQIVLSTAVIMALAIVFGQPWGISLAIGLTLALSSTAIVLQTLTEKGLTQTSGGRSVFSVLLTQDIAVIPILAVLPLLIITVPVKITSDGSISRNLETTQGENYSATMSLVDGLPGWGVTLVTVAAIATVILAGVFLTRPIFRFIHAARLREMYTALALLIVVSISFLMMLVGLSPALGAFIAGVVLASSEFRHELESNILPFKGLLLGLFFVTVGAGINFEILFSDFFLLITMALLLIFVKGLVLFGLALTFGIRGRDRWLFTLGLAQAGEFGFVLVAFSVGQGVLPTSVAETLLLIIALTMLITPFLFILYDLIPQKANDRLEDLEADEIDVEGPVIIAGIGRFGQIVNRLVQGTGFKTVVLDHDMETITLMRRFGFKGFLGDPTRPDILKAAGLNEARVLVVALDDPDASVRLVAHARKTRSDLHIVARAYDRVHVYKLYQAGANDIVREMFDGSLRAGRYVIEQLGLSDYEAAEAERVFYQHDRDAVRQLAELWDPNVPPAENEAYVTRAKLLEKELEFSLSVRSDKPTQM